MGKSGIPFFFKLATTTTRRRGRRHVVVVTAAAVVVVVAAAAVVVVVVVVTAVAVVVFAVSLELRTSRFEEVSECFSSVWVLLGPPRGHGWIHVEIVVKALSR